MHNNYFVILAISHLRYSIGGNIRDLKRLAKMVCARDSKHHNVGQNLFCKSGIFSSRNKRNGPVAQTNKGV
jgi:transcriptional regulator with AAA-type ATPase domain